MWTRAKQHAKQGNSHATQRNCAKKEPMSGQQRKTQYANPCIRSHLHMTHLHPQKQDTWHTHLNGSFRTNRQTSTSDEQQNAQLWRYLFSNSWFPDLPHSSRLISPSPPFLQSPGAEIGPTPKTKHPPPHTPLTPFKKEAQPNNALIPLTDRVCHQLRQVRVL